jgi:hypothetical protein
MQVSDMFTGASNLSVAQNFHHESLSPNDEQAKDVFADPRTDLFLLQAQGRAGRVGEPRSWIKLLSLLDFEVRPPNQTDRQSGVFATNAILCLKQGGANALSAPVKQRGFPRAAHCSSVRSRNQRRPPSLPSAVRLCSSARLGAAFKATIRSALALS